MVALCGKGKGLASLSTICWGWQTLLWSWWLRVTVASPEEKSVWSPALPSWVADRGRTSAAKCPFQLLPHTVGLSAVGIFPTLIRFSDAGVKLWPGPFSSPFRLQIRWWLLSFTSLAALVVWLFQAPNGKGSWAKTHVTAGGPRCRAPSPPSPAHITSLTSVYEVISALSLLETGAGWKHAHNSRHLN